MREAGLEPKFNKIESYVNILCMYFLVQSNLIKIKKILHYHPEMFQNFVLLFFVTANLCFVNARKLKTEVSTATVNSMTADPLTTKTAPAFTTSGVFANQSINDNWKKLLDKNVTYRFAKYFPRSGDNATEEKVELNETDVDKATSGGYKSKMGYFPSEVRPTIITYFTQLIFQTSLGRRERCIE